jgi:uncharacterized membrane protein
MKRKNMKIFTERHTRTVVKTVSWRVLLTISHFINGFIITGSIILGIKIAGWSAVLNSVLYWLHERVWNWLGWNRVGDNGLFFKDGHPRTTTKMICWRIIVNFSNFFIPYFVTGSWGTAGKFFTVAVIVNMTLFYLHERGWNLIRWGKKVI